MQYVPAGLESWPTRTGQLFVKLEKNDKNSIRKGAGYKEFRLRDRTLYLVYESGKNHRLIDRQLDCDYMVPYQNPVELRNRVELVLVNPFHAGNNFYNSFRPHKIDILADSGGFQLLVGTSEFIHPDTPVEFFNKHSDIAMPLDLPMLNSYEPMFFDAVSKMMKANDQYMLPRIDPRVKFSVISHGSTLERRKSRLDAVYRPSPVVAIAGLNVFANESTGVNRTLTGLMNAMYVISQTRKHTEYYHVLGVTSRLWYIIYALLVGTGYVKCIGGDSVSHRMGAITGLYRNQLPYKGGKALQVEKLTHSSVNTSCVCPICQAVSDLNILADFQLCECHAIWYAEQEKDLICDSVQSYLEGKLTLRRICDQWLSHGQYEVLNRVVDYINKVIDKGFYPIHAAKGDSLFEGMGEPPIDVEGKDRYIRIIRNYEKFHKKKFL